VIRVSRLLNDILAIIRGLVPELKTRIEKPFSLMMKVSIANFSTGSGSMGATLAPQLGHALSLSDSAEPQFGQIFISISRYETRI